MLTDCRRGYYTAPLPRFSRGYTISVYDVVDGSARTVLVPKRKDSACPADYRPISVASTLVRGFHKVLARRLGRLVSLDERQRAFRSTDGCADNVFLLDLILRYHYSRHKPLFVVSVDVAKAFDRLAPCDTLRAKSCPQPIAVACHTSGTWSKTGRFHVPVHIHHGQTS